MTIVTRLFLCLCLLSFAPVVPVLAAAAPPDLLAPGGWQAPNPADATLETVHEPDAPGGGGDVLRLTVLHPVTPIWFLQLTRGIPAAVPAGHLVMLRFWARSRTNNPLRVTVEQSVAPYAAVGQQLPTLTPQWQKFSVGGDAPGYGPNGLSAHLQAGAQAGVIEIAGATVTDQGEDPALAAAQKAIQPARIRARIAKYRMGTLTVRVVSASGRPVAHARVHVAQTRHAFLFGCNAFGLDFADTSPAQQAYQSEFAALFNYGTLPFYWGGYEGVPGHTDATRLQAMAAWCVAHGITPKGHPLVWHEVWPGWAPTDPDAAIPLLQSRVSDLIRRFADTIHYWDVINEASSGAASHTPPNGESNWVKRDGPAPVVETALGWARAAGKGRPETLIVNDYETGDPNVALMTRLEKDGHLPDAIGLQSHMHSGVWPMTKVWAVCQQFAQFGRPIHFTETTVLSGPSRTVDANGPYPTDWDTTPEGEAAQADYVTQFYTLLFSHPSLRAITWWDFSDRNAWQKAPAGLVHKDMSPKPAYTRLLELIHKQWWTNVTWATDRAGACTGRVFYGDYQITVIDAKGRTRTQTVTFPEGAAPLTVTVRLP